ncbi:MAG: two-component regulator propeller domain-containing protein [Rhodothermales bacterium]
MRSLLVLLFAVLLLAPAAAAQNERWQAQPSLRNVQALGASETAVWVGTEGGVYSYTLASGEIERFTPVQGLSRVDVQAITYDGARDAVWIGYADGVLDRLDVPTGAVESFFDIAQATRFSSRGINRIEVEADSLLIATEFGVVVFDAARNEVSDTYERFGTLPAASSVGDVLVAPLPDGRPGLWVGTSQGIAYAPLTTPNFREPAAWTADPQSPENVLALAFFDETLFAGTERILDQQGRVVAVGGGFARGADGGWERFIAEEQSLTEWLVIDAGLIGVSQFRILLLDGDGGLLRFDIGGVSGLQAGTLGPNGEVWTGDQFQGLVRYPDLATVAAGTIEPTFQLIPNGPETNNILALDVAEGGAVWASYEAPSPVVNGFGRFDGTTWTNLSFDNGALPDWASISAIHVDDFGNVWAGSGDVNRGRGVFQYTPEGEIVHYIPANSSLLPSAPGSPNYVVTPGLDTDDEGRLWVSNRFASPGLHVRTPDGEWQGLNRPSNVPSSITFTKVYVDSFGQKWLTTRSAVTTGGTGIVVLDTRGTPLDASDDRAAIVQSVGSVGTGLPDAQVNAIVEDRSGRIWLGTDRGLATIFSPGSAFAGDLAAQITWARTPDGASFFLRDLRIFDIAVDPADRKWLASTSGVWLLNAEGDEVIANFTTENSPLPSDVVVAVAVDEESGAVHFATSGGLYTYRGDAIAASPTAEDLFVYPNPVRGNGGPLPEIAITGLVDEADVRVLTVDGQVVASFQTRGGSTRWDGRDQRTGRFVPSGVYIVAASGQNDEGTAYGKVAVIR